MAQRVSRFLAFQANRALRPAIRAAKDTAQLSPEQQQAQQLAAKERELAYNSRFASNLAYSRAGRSTSTTEI